MKRLLIISFFLIFSLVSLIGCDTDPTEEPISVETYSLIQLQADYDQMVGLIDRNPKLFTNLDELNSLVVSQRELLTEGMTKLEFYRVLVKVIAAIRCGHSGIQMPWSEIETIFETDMTYPVSVYLFDEALRIVSINGQTAIEIGDEIKSINGVSIPDITLEMMSMLSADGEGTSLKKRVLADAYFEYYQLFIAVSETLVVEYIDSLTNEIKVEMLSLNSINYDYYIQTPAYEYQITAEYALLTVREFSPHDSYTMQSYLNFFSDFFTVVDQLEIEHVILDIRGNGGGDPRITSALFSYIAITSQPYFNQATSNYYVGLKSNIPLSEPHFDGHLYTLIDGYCFSSCGHLAALIKYQNIGTMIGEETNGSYVCTDSSASYTLTNSRLSFRTSTAAWGVAVEGFELGRGVSPNIEISISFEDYLNGLDTALLYTIDLIESE